MVFFGFYEIFIFFMCFMYHFWLFLVLEDFLVFFKGKNEWRNCEV